MKLTIIRLQQLSEQDRSDIRKIWPQSDIDALTARLDEHHQLYAARFNDRLLGAAIVLISETRARISQLEVREVTRRRGVGLYLLEDIQAQNPHVEHWSVAADGSSSPAVTSAFMQSAGFVRRVDEWILAARI